MPARHDSGFGAEAAAAHSGQCLRRPETTSPTTCMPLGQQASHLDSVGAVLPCAELRVMDDEEREVPPGTTGELWIAGAMVVPGYWERCGSDATRILRRPLEIRRHRFDRRRRLSARVRPQEDLITDRHGYGKCTAPKVEIVLSLPPGGGGCRAGAPAPIRVGGKVAGLMLLAPIRPAARSELARGIARCTSPTTSCRTS